MISANFYPTVVQFDAPSYAPTFHLTNEVRTCDANAFSTYYWLGWLSWDNFPDCWKLSEYVLTNTDLSFTIATQPQNINIGYASIYDNSQNAGSVKYPECYHESPLVNISQSYARYINKLDVMGVGNSGVRFGWHCSYIYGAGDSLTNRGYNDGTFIKSGKSLYDFLYGDETQTIQLASGISYELDFNNIDEDGSFHFTTTYNDNNYDFVISFSYCGVLNMQNVSSTAPASTRNVNAYPMYSLTMDDDVYSFISTGSCFYQPAGYPACIVSKQTQQPIVTPSAGNIIGDYIANGLVCDIPKAFITSSPTYSRLITGNAHVFNRGSDIAVYRMLTRSEMQKIVGLSLRQSDGTYNTYGYQNELSYAPYVTEDNEFTATLITGDLADDEFKAKLRPWQYDVEEWSENDYTEDDLPPYDEGGGGSDEDEGSIPLNTPGALGATNAFTTRYVLNTTQIRTIGQQLWSTIGDGNELTWKNFFLTLSGTDQIDYSLTLSEIISYFVSLKYFPFNLNSVSSTTGENGIRVGTGASLIDAGSTTKTLNDSIVQLNGGRCTIPEKWNNYLDLEPYTTASLYVPYCGTMELPMSVIAGETIGITYLVDMTTGAMTAAIMKYSGSGAYFPIAVMNGSCGFDILMTGTNGNSQMTNAITNLASKSTQWVGQTLHSGLTGLMGGISGRDASGMDALGKMASTVMGIGQDMIQQNIQMPKLYATAPMTSGSSSSLSSLILPQTAYIQIRRHNPYRLGGNYQDELGLIGCRSAYQGLISSANGMGFVKCQNPNLANVADAGATEAEINMIKSLLTDGIFT